MLFVIVRSLALVISFLGYCTLLKKKGIPTSFLPVLVLTGIGSILFVAGILNFLPLATIALFGGGIFLAVKEKFWQLRKHFSSHDLICLGIFFLISFLFALRLHGEKPTHYDSFSHWLTVIRDVLNNGRFPNFQSELIQFQGYPTGASGFAYYICKIIGLETDAVIMFSHAVVIAASLCTLTAFVRKFDLWKGLILFVGGVYCLVASPIPDTALCEPLPDTLISVLSIAALAIVVFYRSKPFTACWLSLAVQIYLVSVKNSGLIMILFNTALVLFYLYQQSSGGKSLFRKSAVKAAAIHSGIPLLIFFLWNRHVAQVFSAGTLSKHSFSLDYYRGTVGAKSIGQLIEVLLIFLKRFFSWNECWLFLIICIALFGFVYLTGKKASGTPDRSVWLSFMGIVISYALFMVGLCGMFLASMDYGESLTLPGYDRYEKTVVIYLVGAIVIFALHAMDSIPAGKYQTSVKAVSLAAVCLILGTQASRISALFIPTHLYENSTRCVLEEAKADYAIPEGAVCAIYGSEVTEDWGYHTYMGRYIFQTFDTEAFAPSAENLPEFDTLTEKFDYLVVMDSDPSLEQYLTENGLTPGQTVYHLS